MLLQLGPRKWRLTFGVGPTKAAAMVFGPTRVVPSCSVTLARVPLPQVSEPLLRRHSHVFPHVGKLISCGNRLVAQCVSDVKPCHATSGWSDTTSEPLSPRGSPVAAVHIESGDAQRLITGRSLSLFGHVPSIPMGDCSPLPASVSHAMASSLGSLIATCSDRCTSLEIVVPSSFGVGPVAPLDVRDSTCSVAP